MINLPEPRVETQNLEQKLVEELIKVNYCDSDEEDEKSPGVVASSLPAINTNFTSSKYRYVIDVIDLLIMDNEFDNKIINFLFFIAAVEDDEELTHVIKERTDNFERLFAPEAIQNGPLALLTSDTRILNRAFSFSINLKNILVINYVLDGAEAHYLTPCVDDDLVFNLIKERKDEKCQEILKLLCISDIILINDGIGNVDNSFLDNAMTDVPSLMPIKKSNKTLSTRSQLGKSKSKIKNKGTINKRKKPNNSILEVESPKNKKHSFLMQAKKNPFNKFLQKSDIIEIAIRHPHISNEEEVNLIVLLYENLSTPTIESVNLFKTLIYYEQIETFEMLLKYRLENNFKKVDLKTQATDIDPELLIMGRKDADGVYDFDEIVSDCFAYSITLNKIHIAFYLLQKYNDDVYGNKGLCIKAIFDSFKNDDQQTSHVIYLEERMFILEKFSKHLEYKMGLEFLTVIHDEVLSKPTDN